jgi:hypothetical protein
MFPRSVKLRTILNQVAAQCHRKFKAGLSSGGRDFLFAIVAAGGIDIP